MSHVYYLTFISLDGLDIKGVTGDRASDSTFVRMKPMDIFKETSGHVQPCLWQHNQEFKAKT